MANRLTLKSRTLIAHPSGVAYQVWVYEIDLDAVAAAQGGVRLGLSAQIPIVDPAEYPKLASVAGTQLVRPPGSAVQYVELVGAPAATPVEIALIAPAASDAFTPITLGVAPGAGVQFADVAFALTVGGPEQGVQVIEGPSAASHLQATPKAPESLLPYSSEPFGVYQPLIGWRSGLSQELLSRALANRVRQAARLVGGVADITDERPVGVVRIPKAADRTGTRIGGQMATAAARDRDVDWADLLSRNEGSPLAKATMDLVTEAQRSLTAHRTGRLTARQTADLEILTDEPAMATVLHHLVKEAPSAVSELFRPAFGGFDRAIAAAKLIVDPHPARSAFLSPIGILHLFREYFFQLATFLGPPVGHVWISPGSTVELVEVNSRKTLVERLVEQSTETTVRTELGETQQDELSDAIKVDNANDMKLGVGATASGGIAGVFQASGSASFNLDVSRKQAREQTHKKMREQSSKLSSEVRQNYKTTFRTVTETTDTSSRRYVIQNTSTRLVSYELSRKMRKVAVQVQDQGRRLCWQLYIDNPGDPLGIGEFVHAKAEALDISAKLPEKKDPPTNQEKTFPSSIAFILYQGSDDDHEETYVPSSDHPDHGIHKADLLGGKDEIIQFVFEIKCPPAPAGFVLSQVTALDFHGAQVKWDPNFAVDPVGDKFTIRLTHANFGGKPALPFDVTLVYEPTQATKDDIEADNKAAKAEYDDEAAAAKEKAFYETLRARLKLSSQVKTRPPEDLREEERNEIYRGVIERLYGNAKGWTSEDYHVASELIRYLFDVDAMLYFVAPDWWRPRHQELVRKDASGELQPTIIAEPAISDMFLLIGGKLRFIRGHRPYYLITEETAPAPMGSSLGWLIQLDGDVHRNAFLNSPWVKAVLPIRPGREREGIVFLERPEVAGADGLQEPYPFDAAQDPPEYAGKTLRQVLLIIADRIADEHRQSLKPVPIDQSNVNSKLALPTETVFAHGFDPLEDGIEFGAEGFKVFSEWIEVVPTDQVVATEYRIS